MSPARIIFGWWSFVKKQLRLVWIMNSGGKPALSMMIRLQRVVPALVYASLAVLVTVVMMMLVELISSGVGNSCWKLKMLVTK